MVGKGSGSKRDEDEIGLSRELIDCVRWRKSECVILVGVVGSECFGSEQRGATAASIECKLSLFGQ